MTRRRMFNARCRNCEVDALCPQCGKPVSPATPFSDWLREQPEIDSHFGFRFMDMDGIWWHPEARWFLTFESKTRRGRIPDFQGAMLARVGRMIELGVNAYNSRFGEDSAWFYSGHYNIIFERTTPDDSWFVLINGEHHDPSAVLFLLRYGYLPSAVSVA